MPKHIIEFNLPEEIEQLEITMKASNYYLALENLDNWLRNLDKYEDKEFVKIDEIRDKIRELIKD